MAVCTVGGMIAPSTCVLRLGLAQRSTDRIDGVRGGGIDANRSPTIACFFGIDPHVSMLIRQFATVALTLAISLGVLSLTGISTVHAQRVAATVDSTASVIDYTGSAPMHDWTGTSRSVTGTLLIDRETPDSSRAVIRVPVATFDSGTNRRDRNMREVTEAEKYPMVEFRSTHIDPTHWGRSSEGHSGQWAVTGDVTFHGQTHPVDATVAVQVTDDSVYAHAQFPISVTRFGVERPKLLWTAPIADTIRIDARIAAAIDESTTVAEALEHNQNEVTGTRRIQSTELRDIRTRNYDGTRGALHASVRIPPNEEREWMVALYGFTDRPTGLTEAQSIDVQADQYPVNPVRTETATRELDNGTTVEIIRLFFSRSGFDTIAEALGVTTSVGSTRFFADWSARSDLRAIVDEIESPGPMSLREDD